MAGTVKKQDSWFHGNTITVIFYPFGHATPSDKHPEGCIYRAAIAIFIVRGRVRRNRAALPAHLCKLPHKDATRDRVTLCAQHTEMLFQIQCNTQKMRYLPTHMCTHHNQAEMYDERGLSHLKYFYKYFSKLNLVVY